MNKRRRRYGKARRHKARVTREMRAWSKCNWERVPRGGRLRNPAIHLALAMGASMQAMHDHANKMLGPFFAAVRAHVAAPLASADQPTKEGK